MNIKKYFPKDIFIILIVVSILNALRIILLKSDSFLWLYWNIFLAIIPYMISSFLVFFSEKNRLKKIVMIILGIIWLLFIPNAPYLITDLIHIGEIKSVPLVYDAFLLFGVAWVGVYLWFYSNHQMELLIKEKFSIKRINIIMFFIIFSTSFGIYLGRFLRLNSWEVFSDSAYFLKILHQKLLIKGDPNDYLYIVLFTVFLYAFYLAFKYRNK